MVSKKEINDKQRASIAGEAISLIRLVKIAKKTFFVEDKAHLNILQKLIQRIDPTLDVDIIPLGNKDSVKSMYKTSKANPGEWDQALFLIDGDNEGNPFPGENQFIHLSKYCIENYLFDIPTMVLVLNKTEGEIKSVILQAIKFKKTDILKNYKFLEFVIDRLAATDITVELLSKFDCSEILDRALSNFGVSSSDYIDKYIAVVPIEVFDGALVSEIK